MPTSGNREDQSVKDAFNDGVVTGRGAAGSRTDKQADDLEVHTDLTSNAEVTREANSETTLSTQSDGGCREKPQRGATGPRTEAGKRRASQNSTKFGIFSRAVVLKGESLKEYHSLLEGVRESRRPETEFEDLLVEKIAIIFWRYRRYLKAEGADIKRNRLLFEPALQSQRDLTLLIKLRDGIKADGLNKERDTQILEEIYGEEPLSGEPPETLYVIYIRCFDTATVTEKVRQEKGYATSERCTEIILEEIATEIGRLKRLSALESERSKLEILRRNVPELPGLDRLLRYEANLQRELDRTLAQLERVQRLRLGQPVAPRIDVNLSL